MKGSVSDFYDGKSVLITGAAGYIGAVLMEILLRTCVGLKKVYIVLRGRKGLSAEERKNIILKKIVFEKLQEECPEVFDKVHVLPGDTSKQDFGLMDHDLQRVVEEVSIVFHIAAVIAFTKPLRFTLENNLMSVKYAVDLCRRLHKLDALVYTSTAFSNTNRAGQFNEEIVYRLPYKAERFVEVFQKGDDAELEYLIEVCGATWPNNYTLSKCIAENFLSDCATDLPVAIVRPSLTLSFWKEPHAGYMEQNNGVVTLTVGNLLGFVRVVRGDPNFPMDIIPVDVVCNSHILAAIKVARGGFENPFVVNCATKIQHRSRFNDYAQGFLKLCDAIKDNPIPRSYQLPRAAVRQSAFWYWLDSLLEHYAPALVLDTIQILMGKKPKLLSLYILYEKTLKNFKFFLENLFEQENKNLLSLSDFLHEEDKKNFYVDPTEFRVTETKNHLKRMKLFRYDNSKAAERRNKLIWMSRFTFFIKCLVLTLMGIAAYLIINGLGRMILHI